MKDSGSELLDLDPSPDAFNSDEGAVEAPQAVAQALKELSHKEGPPLTTGELARITGMSATFIRKEIDSGYLKAARVGRGRKCVFRISVREARRYVRQLGLL